MDFKALSGDPKRKVGEIMIPEFGNKDTAIQAGRVGYRSLNSHEGWLAVEVEGTKTRRPAWYLAFHGHAAKAFTKRNKETSWETLPIFLRELFDSEKLWERIANIETQKAEGCLMVRYGGYGVVLWISPEHNMLFVKTFLTLGMTVSTKHCALGVANL